MPLKILAEEQRGLLLDIFVFLLNLFLMRLLTGYVVVLFQLANRGEPLAQLTLTLGCLAMWSLPVAGAVLKRWHFHRRLQEAGRNVDVDFGAWGCIFNPIFYFCLNLVLMSVIVSSVGRFLFGERLLQNGALFLPLVFGGLLCTIGQTFLIYRYFSPPKKPPKSEFLRQPDSETLGDICIFINMILFQIAWNLLTLAELGRPSSPLEFCGRLFFLCFIEMLVYFPGRLLFLAEDIDRPRTWLTMLLANSPVIVKVLIGTSNWQ